jgi:class 3 adenylate cyclase/catechol 2,3-dioxygenase-like lactoylglutathione lyase family enzyme
MSIRVVELHHHAIRSAADPATADRVRDFYVDVLGLSADPSRPDRPGRPGHWLNVGEQAQIHLVGATGGNGNGGAAAGDDAIDTTEPHVALSVVDIDNARRELHERGIAHRMGRAGVDGRSLQIFLRDPAGNLIELRQHDDARAAARARLAEPAGYTRVHGAVMFADMRGFTRISERLSPAEVVPLLNEYFELLTSIAVNHGGTVFNMAGDGLMVGFGVPNGEADAARRAFESAREMLERFGALAADWKRRLDVDTGLGIGINAGEVIAGNVGSHNFMSYTIVGDTVNVASRLSQRARAGEALMSSAVHGSLGQDGAHVPTLPLPALQLRGRAAPVAIFCLPASERIEVRED